MKRAAASKHELIEPTLGEKRYVRRKADGTFGKTIDVGRALAAAKSDLVASAGSVVKGGATGSEEKGPKPGSTQRPRSIHCDNHPREEDSNALLRRITVDPEICHGKPCVRGLRYPVTMLRELPSSGMTHQEILADYEDLEPDNLLAVLAYAPKLSDTRRITLAA